MQGDADLHYHIICKYATYYQYTDEIKVLLNKVGLAFLCPTLLRRSEIDNFI